jgi:tetratricopeptide (TPR) repeat protein
MTAAVDANNEHWLWVLYNWKMQLSYHFGFYRIANSLLDDINRTGKTFVTHFSIYFRYFLGASMNYEMYYTSGQRSVLRVARKYHKALKRLEFSPNSTPLLAFLSAQDLAAKGKPARVVLCAYDRAIDAMAESNWPNWEGTANERAAFYLIRIGDIDLAEQYFDRALYLYLEEWGATTKYDWLLEVSENALAKKPSVDDERRSAPQVVGNIIRFAGDDAELVTTPVT